MKKKIRAKEPDYGLILQDIESVKEIITEAMKSKSSRYQDFEGLGFAGEACLEIYQEIKKWLDVVAPDEGDDEPIPKSKKKRKSSKRKLTLVKNNQ